MEASLDVLAGQEKRRFSYRKGKQVNYENAKCLQDKTVLMVTYDDKYASYATRIVHQLDEKLVDA